MRGISKTQRRAESALLVSHTVIREGNADIPTEFRGAPGVLSGEHCLVWVEVAVSFVQAAAQYGTEDTLNECGSNVAGLRKFISKASVNDMNKPELLDVFFGDYEGTRVPVDGKLLEEPEGEGEDLDTEMRAKFDERIKKLPNSVFT